MSLESLENETGRVKIHGIDYHIYRQGSDLIFFAEAGEQKYKAKCNPVSLEYISYAFNRFLKSVEKAQKEKLSRGTDNG